MLLRGGADASHPGGPSKDTPLHICCRHSRTVDAQDACIVLLLGAGAEVRHRKKMPQPLCELPFRYYLDLNRTPLKLHSFACSLGFVFNAQVSAKNYFSDSPLSLAEECDDGGLLHGLLHKAQRLRRYATAGDVSIRMSVMFADAKWPCLSCFALTTTG